MIAGAPPRRSRRWRRLRGWLLLLLFAGAGYYALKRWVLVERPIPVTVHRIAKGDVERIVSNTKAGSVRTRRIALLSADAPGRMVKLLKREGQAVQADEPLAALDDRLARAQLVVAKNALETARSSEAQARIKLEDARRELARVEQLHRKGTVSRAELDRATTRHDLAGSELKAAGARIQQYQAQVAQIQVEVDRLVLKAPFSGTIAQRFVEVGEWVVPGKPVLELLDPAQLYVRAELDEVDLAQIRPGLVARIQLDPFRGKTFPGRVVRVAPRVSETQEQNRTVEIEVAFDRSVAVDGFKVGMSADVEVVIERRERALRVPTLAILEGERVLVVRGGAARAVRIRRGLSNWKFTEVRSGLVEGDQVIVSLDREEVKDGAAVRVAVVQNR